MFFAATEAADLPRDVRITPVRQEHLKDRLGDRFHEPDTQMMINEGKQMGRQEEAMIIPDRQLSRRFETVPAWAKELLENAELRHLEQWADRILDARTVDEVFGRKQ